ncbi:Hypothetical protein CINCED_3A018557 [Cinara cedri]|uniref:Uncharacterized protein n=1 Tax=Cinara cedri TaxID=506608 RepID=A0A5E4MIQ1_9HEMI|nr:Hypothetical protein CINCED_3A018557 [Cinara cedri]
MEKEEMYRPTIGKEILYTLSNDNGNRLITFAMSKGLRVSSTLFLHKDIHKESKNLFFENLCNAFVAANIPLHKLDNHVLKSLLEKHPGLAIENLLINKLNGTPSKSYLVGCKELESTNYETICQFINFSLKIFPGIKQKVLLSISDAGTDQSTTNIKNIFFFIKMLIHMRCMAHVVNRVLEKIRELYPDINKLITMKKKASRKEMSGIPLSPEPDMIRWRTWLNAALFYANNFEEFKNVIESLTDDTISVKKLKQIIQNNAVKCGLAFIKSHLSELSMNLKNVEESNSELLKSMDIFRKIDDILTNIPGPNRKKINEKCMYEIEKNEGYTTLKSYYEVI